MPNRMLREGILTSPRIAKLGWAEEVFYRRLMSVVDDYGRYYGDHSILRAACYPRQLAKVTDGDVETWARGLVDAGLIELYVVDGERYVQVLDFRQQVRAKKSKFPHQPSTCAADAQQMQTNEHLDVVVDVVVDVGDIARADARPIPDADHEKLAGTLGLSCQAEFAKYRDWLATNGRRHKNPAAGFRNWLRKAAEFRRTAPADKRSATAAAMGLHTEVIHEPSDITAEATRVA